MDAEDFLSVGKPRSILSLQNAMTSPRSQPNRRRWRLPCDLVPLRRRFIEDWQLRAVSCNAGRIPMWTHTGPGFMTFNSDGLSATL
jgi:hypothetical protein